jgi:hypothetical protein
MICQFLENYFMNAFSGLPGAAKTAAIARDKKIAIFMMKFFLLGWIGLFEKRKRQWTDPALYSCFSLAFGFGSDDSGFYLLFAQFE